MTPGWDNSFLFHCLRGAIPWPRGAAIDLLENLSRLSLMGSLFLMLLLGLTDHCDLLVSEYFLGMGIT